MGSFGRVQWDPERDMLEGNGKEPRQMLRTRAIQIGLKGRLSEEYVRSIVAVEDVTDLAKKIGYAHVKDYTNKSKDKEAMDSLDGEIPDERPYLPQCTDEVLVGLGMAHGATALAVHSLGRGKVCV